jgi:hypothetical protein
MRTDYSIESISEWISIIYDPDNETIPGITGNPEEFITIFTWKLAESLYADLGRKERKILHPYSINKDFGKLGEADKTLWYDIVSSIPGKLKALNLFIRPFKKSFRTCIITDSEIEKLVRIDVERYLGTPEAEDERPKEESEAFFRDLNYLIPAQLVKAGYEIIRKEEESLIDPILLRKLARAIHSRYLQDIRNRDKAGKKTTSGYPGDEGNLHLVEFEKLPEDIMFSNLDNAYHIPAKLLAKGTK